MQLSFFINKIKKLRQFLEKYFSKNGPYIVQSDIQINFFIEILPKFHYSLVKSMGSGKKLTFKTLRHRRNFGTEFYSFIQAFIVLEDCCMYIATTLATLPDIAYHQSWMAHLSQPYISLKVKIHPGTLNFLWHLQMGKII